MCPKFKKQHLVSIFAIAFIILIFFSGTGAAAPGTVHNISGIYYSTLQAAINAAPDGDTIYVDSNTYKENVVVNVTGLILIGNDTGTGMPVVDGMGLGHAINITADGVTLDWFNTTNATGMAGIFLSSNNSLILNNTANNNEDGIFLEYSGNNTLTGNNATNNSKRGIYLYRSNNNNTLTNNIASDNYNDGIQLAYSSYNALISNNANNNVNGNDGIYLLSSNNNTLTSNNVINNTEYGIFLSESNNNTLTDNSANNNSVDGIRLYDSSNNIFTSNTVNNNTATGIYLETSSNNNILTENVALNNTVSGILLESLSINNAMIDNIANMNNEDGIRLISSNNTLTGNTANNNTWNGIRVYSSSNNTLTSNTATNNTISGIRLESSSNNNVLTNNILLNNTVSGIDLYTLSINNILTGNIAKTNDEDGIHLKSSNNTLTGNTVSNNILNGIRVNSSGNNTLTGNIVANNTVSGILLDSLSINNVLNNNIANMNSEDGIRLNSSNNNTLTGNNANSNVLNGIFLNSSNNNTFTNNTLLNNTVSGIRLEVSSDNNVLTENVANMNNGDGIRLATSSNNNTLVNNTVNSNAIYGIFLNSSSNNTLYQNILYNNTNENAYDDDTNNWNSSNFGNYYGDIVAIDIAEPYGVNDTEYSINGSSNKDYHPLIVASSATSSATVSGTSALSFTVSTTLFDHASVGIENITLYYNSTDNSTWRKYGNSTTGIFTLTASSSGTYHFRTVATDTYGMVENESLTYDSKTTVSISAPVTPSGSSGGGSGGGSSGEEYENIEVKDVVREYINKDEEASYNFKEEKNAIDVIKFTALKNAGTISATVEVLKGTSSLVKTAPSGKVYQNMNIWVGKAGFATSNNIEDLRIGFKVEKSWIKDHDIDESSIRLCRYNNDEWTSLSTSKSSEDDKYVYFEAETPGFSPFAIKVEETEDVTAVDMIIAEMTKVFDDTKPVTQTDVESDTEEETSGLPGFSIIMGILGIAGAILVRRR